MDLESPRHMLLPCEVEIWPNLLDFKFGKHFKFWTEVSLNWGYFISDFRGGDGTGNKSAYGEWGSLFALPKK